MWVNISISNLKNYIHTLILFWHLYIGGIFVIQITDQIKKRSGYIHHVILLQSIQTIGKIFIYMSEKFVYKQKYCGKKIPVHILPKASHFPSFNWLWGLSPSTSCNVLQIPVSHSYLTNFRPDPMIKPPLRQGIMNDVCTSKRAKQNMFQHFNNTQHNVVHVLCFI